MNGAPFIITALSLWRDNVYNLKYFKLGKWFVHTVGWVFLVLFFFLYMIVLKSCIYPEIISARNIFPYFPWWKYYKQIFPDSCTIDLGMYSNAHILRKLWFMWHLYLTNLDSNFSLYTELILMHDQNECTRVLTGLQLW